MSLAGLSRTAFWYLRHGQTDWNKDNLAQGRTDIPLNEYGRAQAREAAAMLRGTGICRIIASPLSRARETAEAAAAVTNAPLSFDEELQEVSFGDHEGRPMLAQWFDDWVAERYTPPGAESFAELRARAVRAINRALLGDAPLLVVAHGALFRALRSAMGLEPNVRAANAVPMFCEPSGDGITWSLTAAPARAG